MNNRAGEVDLNRGRGFYFSWRGVDWLEICRCLIRRAGIGGGETTDGIGNFVNVFENNIIDSVLHDTYRIS